MQARRSYSDEQKAVALAGLDANTGNVARTARQLGLPRTTGRLRKVPAAEAPRRPRGRPRKAMG
jgi:hypothetical protein